MRDLLLGAAVLATIVVAAMWPPIRQSPAYHLFADTRSFLGIPNCLDVLSNLPFAIVGVLGLRETLSWPGDRTAKFSDPWERWPYAALFGGVALTSLGSGYYHLAPDNARLVWDRLPMSVGFMGLLTALLAERVSVRLGRWLFVPLLATGAAGVFYWHWSELQNAGDLRLYVVVQFGSLLWIVLLLVLYPARYAGTAYLVTGLAAYGIGKIFEVADRHIFGFGEIVSGHTLKHLVAAAGVACVVIMLRDRAPTRSGPSLAWHNSGATWRS
jgi:predicted membrane channel-forming protein YqfA (hemolysin III family)